MLSSFDWKILNREWQVIWEEPIVACFDVISSVSPGVWDSLKK